MAIAPDGRIFICQQGGSLRVIKNGSLLSTPFVHLTVNSISERGLLGVTFDPNFTANGYLYLYYTATTPNIHNRLSRFTANGDVAVAGSELILLELNPLTAGNHNGGAIHFGRDGKLYVGVGDNAVSANAQTMDNLFGKMLRINSNGTIPTDNPFYYTASGVNRTIWAMGLRNPFTFAFQPGTGRLLINDVGEGRWEEINEGAAGANYGWPTCEGECGTPQPNFLDPIYQYPHGTGTSAGYAISGGAFYNPATVQFPSSYVGNYFFADYVNGWISRMDPANGNQITVFATGLSAPTDLKVSADGKLYYLSLGDNAVYEITYTGSYAPQITQQPISQTIRAGQPVTFSVSATGSGTLSYQWQKNNADISGATQSSLALSSVSTADNGAAFRCIVRNSAGSTISAPAILTVTLNSLPTATITSPTQGRLYTAGETIQFAGAGADPEDGTLPASRFSWTIVFHHDTHTHPYLGPIQGISSGSFVIPTRGEVSANVWYRIHLTVTDSVGAIQTTFLDIRPRTATLSFVTAPPGMQITLDGQPQITPVSVVSVVGIERALGVISPQLHNGASYGFISWSDGGSATHTISTPSSGVTYTAAFQAQSSEYGPITFVNSSSIFIPGQGAANPYPSIIQVSGMSGTISQAKVTIDGLSHSYLQDARLLLVSPNGQKSILMAHVGGANAVSDVILTFDDTASASLPGSAKVVSGAYRPTSFASGSFLSPAPPSPYDVALSAFNNQSPNGTWSLYAMDDAVHDQGVIARGWSLTLTTVPANSPGNATVSTVESVTIPDRGMGSPYPSVISVSGLSGSIVKLNATLNSLTHSYSQDVRILLVGPGGQNTILLARIGSNNSVTSAKLTFDDAASSKLSSSARIVSGSYQPSSNDSNTLFPLPAPASPYGTALSVFNGTSPNGNWSLFVIDDAPQDGGRLAEGWSLTFTLENSPTPPPPAGTFANTQNITIPHQGVATPYPSSLSVSGMSGALTEVTATLAGLSHTYPDDLRALLVGPTGEKSILISRAGGGGDINDINLTFDNAASASLTDSSQLVSGSYLPGMFGLNDSLTAPAPASPYVADMSVFRGINPNGTWSLFVLDSAAGDQGSISGGWSLTLKTIAPFTQSTSISAPSVGDKGLLARSSLSSASSPPVLSVSLLWGGKALVSVRTQPGMTYLLQVSNDLTVWKELMVSTATADRLDYVDALVDPVIPRFYRVRQWSPSEERY